jgi:predicted PhzF superfamily epimerase YddE/YHI9
VPSFGGTLVPSVCDVVVCAFEEAAPGIGVAELAATGAAGAPLGVALSALGGW